ncbi:MAG: pyridoxal phosphate-dependent aminotransferase [Bacteroides sp.]|nr:pyridoxal phosphate-dependent aminotransferase [Prevotella sp.]MCM1407884.1 pyridoxal phosphate-dependent aminotransferase [Treponema brennaborense]MCM1469626.1 pyridoxal phosphate-dependent aminotransferase [Bacteroides sp.]
MAIAPYIKEIMLSKDSSVIRKMFEEGAVLKAKYGEDKVFDFSIGNPDIEPPDEVKEYVKNLALHQEKGCHGYMPNAGYESARQAMADKVSAEQGLCGNKALSYKHIVMSVGAAGALNAVFKSILSSGDEIIVPAPFFSEYRNYAMNHNGILKAVPSKSDFSLDADAIARALTEKTAALLINSPNNPSGKIYTDRDIAEIAAVLSAHGGKCGRKPYLICDEPYRAITYGGKKVAPVFPVYDMSVVVSSFAKNLSLPGERIGYIAVNPACPDADELIAACIFSTRALGFVNAPAFFQRVVEHTWNAPADYSSYEKRRNQIASVVKNAGIEFCEPEGAFYLFCKVPQPRRAENEPYVNDDFAFCDHLKKFNILCAPGTGFGCAGYFRAAYCVSENTILNSAEAFKAARESW